MGSSTGSIQGPSNNDNPPTLITEGWKYYDGSDWPKAEENDVIFEDWSNAKSKFLKDKNMTENFQSKSARTLYIYINMSTAYINT